MKVFFVPLEDEDELHAAEHGCQEGRNDVDGPPRRLHEELLVHYNPQERHNRTHEGDDPNEPSWKLQSQLQVRVPSNVGSLKKVINVYEGHWLPHGLQLHHLPYIVHLLPDALRLPVKLVQEWHSGHEYRERQRGAHGANLRERKSPPPSIFIVQSATTQRPKDAAKKSHRIARRLGCSLLVFGLVLAPLNDDGVGADIRHDYTHGAREKAHGEV
mmetsp:Transcript_12239/g.25080  ORF Transcript_12239/g.25080 Transcript_12239/m.25080 type:complete len:215 (-) Transcript_12239:422-1066(-)